MTDYVAEIKNRLDIETLLGRLGIHPNSSGFVTSPAKQEKTPSAKLYPPHHYVDYSGGGDGKSRDLIEYYMIFCGLDFKTAVKELCSLAGIPHHSDNGRDCPPRTDISSRHEHVAAAPSFKSDFLECLTEYEKEIYYETLGRTDKEKTALNEVKMLRIEHNSPIFTEMFNYCSADPNPAAMSYLLKDRALPDEALPRFKLFTINNYSRVNNHLKKVFDVARLQLSGLYNEKGNLIFYNHRIIIPYLHENEPVYLRGRYFDDNGPKTDEFKYLGLKNDALGVNTPKRFFNLDTLSRMLPGEKIYIVEGEFDAIALEAMGYNALCIPGVGNMPDERMLARLSSYNPVICVDTDEAGQKLADRLRKAFNKLGIIHRTKDLPNKDINDFLINVA